MTSNYPPPTEQEVQAALCFIDAGCSRDDWAIIGMAIKSEFGSSGFSLFEPWSATSDKYDAKNCRATFKGLKAAGKTTISTLFDAAIKGGWKPDKKELSAEEKKAFAIKQAERKKLRDIEQAEESAHTERMQELVAEQASFVWCNLLAEGGKSDYLKGKGVGAFGVRFVQNGFIVVVDSRSENVYLVQGRQDISDFFARYSSDGMKEDDAICITYFKHGGIVVPLFDEQGKLWNLQYVNSLGTKLFIKGGRKSGCFCFYGDTDNYSIFILSEGYATGASCHLAKGWPFFTAFDCGNLLAVARAIRKRWPGKLILVAGDNDQESKDNPGATKALQVVSSVAHCTCVIPRFKAANDDGEGQQEKQEA